MQETEQQIKTLILDREITSIRVFNVSDNYIEFIPGEQWALDGGIQIEFDKDFICLGWDFENQGFDFSLSRPLTEILGEAPYYQIDPAEVKGVSDLQGSRIADCKIKWEFYQELDEDGEPKEEKIFMPVELFLSFENGAFLQLATISFVVDRHSFAISKAEYNIFGRLLVSVNKKVEIHT